MRRSAFSFIAALALLSAASGIWFGGLRDETDIAKILNKFPRPNDTPFLRCADSFYWLAYAREMVDTGKLRVRFTKMDNAPYGRPNLGWASLNAWYLVALGKAWSMTTGLPIDKALPAAAVWANPLLYFLSLAAILLIGWRLQNLPSAAAAALILGTAPRVYEDFPYAVPGHHGWHDLACFSALVCLAAAIRKSNSRRWFIAAGFSSAIAIWIGATQQAFGLAAAGVGAVVAMFLIRSQKMETREVCDSCVLPAAEGWRAFGITAAIAALFFYLIEYLPGPLTMRLEINHPIYALGFLLGGEFLCRAQRLILPTKTPRRADLPIALGIGFALAAISILVFFGPPSWHTMRQPFMQRLHQELAEFQPITTWSGWESIVILGVPALLVLAACCQVFGEKTSTRQRVALLTCVFPCAVAIVLSFVQLRWAGIAGAAGAAVSAVLFADLRRAKSDDRLASSERIPLSIAVCIFMPIVLSVFWLVRRNIDDTQHARAESLDRLATMEVASALQSESKIRPAIAVFSGQKERQAWIGYVTGISAVGSLYWDSPIGIHDEAELLATYDDEAALRVVRTRGITHIVTTPNGSDVIAYHYIFHANKTAPQIRQTLAYRLAEPQPQPPSWLQLLPTQTPAMIREGIRIYRVL